LVRSIAYWLPWLILLALFSPYVFLGENASFRIHDNLDSHIGLLKIVTNPEYFFRPNDFLVPDLLGELPRSALPSEFNLISLLFYLFSPFKAYLINKFFVIIVGYWGMWLFLNELYRYDKNLYLQISLISFAYAFLPYYPLGGISISGIPLLFYSIIKINRDSSEILPWLMILFYGLYSSLTFSGIFIIGILILIIFLYSINRKKLMSGIFGVIFLSLIYIIQDYRLFFDLFYEPFISHRSEFFIERVEFSRALRSSISNIAFGHIDSNANQLLLIPIIILTIFMGAFKNNFFSDLDKTFIITSLISIAIIGIASIMFGFYYYSGFQSIQVFFQEIIPINLSRLYTVSPFFWYVLLSVSIAYLLKAKLFSKKLITFYLSIVITANYINTEFIKYVDNPSWRDFFAEDKFADIKNQGLVEDEDLIVAIGIHPSVLQFNGLKTLGSYHYNYPLEIKHKIYELSSNELKKNQKLENYFLNWGSRAYFWSSEIYQLDNMFLETSKDKELVIQDIDLDFSGLKDYGVRYILSNKKILSPENLAANLIYQNNDALEFLDIYLYEL